MQGPGSPLSLGSSSADQSRPQVNHLKPGDSWALGIRSPGDHVLRKRHDASAQGATARLEAVAKPPETKLEVQRSPDPHLLQARQHR